MAYDTSSTKLGYRGDLPSALTNSMFDWMMSMQRQVLSFQKQALSMYGMPAAHFNGALQAAATAPRVTGNEEVIPLGRETLNVGTRVINQGTTRIRRFVIETPVEEKVALRNERVIVERRRPIAVSSNGDTLTEKTVEMSDTTEVPVVWKSVELAEEVVLRREVNERMEAGRGTVRHDEVESQEIEQPAQEVTTTLPARRETVSTATRSVAARSDAHLPELKPQAAMAAAVKAATDAALDHKAGDHKPGEKGSDPKLIIPVGAETSSRKG